MGSIKPARHLVWVFSFNILLINYFKCVCKNNEKMPCNLKMGVRCRYAIYGAKDMTVRPKD